jgi:hypothetical protein
MENFCTHLWALWLHFIIAVLCNVQQLSIFYHCHVLDERVNDRKMGYVCTYLEQFGEIEILQYLLTLYHRLESLSNELLSRKDFFYSENKTKIP